jgi:hypothetical protein
MNKNSSLFKFGLLKANFNMNRCATRARFIGTASLFLDVIIPQLKKPKNMEKTATSIYLNPKWVETLARGDIIVASNSLWMNSF